MLRAHLMVLAAVCAMAALAHSGDVNDVIPEMQETQADVELINDDDLLELQVETQGKASVKEAIEVSAMDELKAYCKVAARSNFFQETNDKHKNAIMYVIQQYAKDPLSNEQKELVMGKKTGSANNIVTQYGLMMGKLDAKARGMFQYMLQNLDDAILQGKSPFTRASHGERDTKYIVFDWKMLGLESAPHYFFKFKVTPTAWYAAQASIPKGQTAKAITAKLMENKKNYYNSALAGLIKDVKAKQAKAYNAAVADSHKAIKKAFVEAPDKLDNLQILKPMTTEGSEAALNNKEYQGMPQPLMAELKKKALAKAKVLVRQDAAKANARRITQETEQKAKAKAEEQKIKETAAKEKAEKQRIAREKLGKEKQSKEASQKRELNTKESNAKNERRQKDPHGMSGRCCIMLAWCGTCCDKCPNGGGHNTHHMVGMGTCGSSRKCNSI